MPLSAVKLHNFHCSGLQAFADSSERRLVTLAEGLEQGLDAQCHEAHVRLSENVAEASGGACKCL